MPSGTSLTGGGIALLAIVVCACLSACSETGDASDGNAGACGQASCGGASGAGGAAGSGAAGGRAGSGGASGGSSGAAGARVCGARPCTASEICVRPSLGGTPGTCNPLPDGGQCPGGWIYKSLCDTLPIPGPGCEVPPLGSGPDPYCIDRPTSCGTTFSCACLSADVCVGIGVCGSISNGNTLCVAP